MTTPNYLYRLPTPWVHGTHGISANIYKFRLRRTRHNGKITIELAKDSPTAPGQVRCVTPSRPGWWEFVQAAQRLLDTRTLNTTHNPDSAHASTMWNKNKQDYATHPQDVATLVGLLPSLIDPKARTPIQARLDEARLAAQAQGGVRPSHVKARVNRYEEIMNTLHRVSVLLNPLQTRMQDARKMKGYDKEEVRQMNSYMTKITADIYQLKRLAKVSAAKQRLPDDTRTTRISPHTANEPMQVDFVDTDESPLSPQEQQIQQQQERNEPEYQRYTGWNEEDIAASQATGRARGIIKDEVQWAEAKAAINAGAPEERRKPFTIDMTQFKDEAQQAPKPKGFAILPEEPQP